MKYYIKAKTTVEVEKETFYRILQQTPKETRQLIEFKDKKVIEFYN